MALLLNEKFRGQTLMRAVLFLPWAVPTIIVALTWRWIYDGSPSGLINFIRIDFFEQQTLIQFLADPEPGALVGDRGRHLAGHPLLHHDAPGRDAGHPQRAVRGGGPRWRERLPPLLRHHPPQPRPGNHHHRLLSTIWTANSINFIFALTRGGPVDATMTFPMLAYEVGIAGARQLGLAAAVSVLFFPLFIVAIYLLTKRMLSTEGRG